MLRKNERVSLFERLKEPGRKPRRAAAGRLTSRELICGTYVHYLAPMQATLEIATNQQDACTDRKGAVRCVQCSHRRRRRRAERPTRWRTAAPRPGCGGQTNARAAVAPWGAGGKPVQPTTAPPPSVLPRARLTSARVYIYIYISNERTEACKNNCAHRGLNPRPQDTYCTAPFNRGKQEKLTSN